jgi:hypothetical protein
MPDSRHCGSATVGPRLVRRPTPALLAPSALLAAAASRRRTLVMSRIGTHYHQKPERHMHRLRVIAVAAGFIAAASPSATALAQGLSGSGTCQNVGNTAAEPFGDGRAMMNNVYSCAITGGAFEGTVVTGSNYWEIRGGEWTLLTGNGAIRKPGAFAVYQITDATLTVVMKDGKPAGWTSSGRGRYQTASGSLAQVAGKSFTWKGAAIRPGFSSLDWTVVD